MTSRRHKYDVVVCAPMLAPLLSTKDIGSTGGGETQLLLVARMLAAQGLRVCLATYDAPGAQIPATVDGIDIAVRPRYAGRGKLRRARELAGLVRELAVLDGTVYLTRIASYHVGAVGLAARLRRRRFVYSSAHVTDFDHRSISPTLRDHVMYVIGLRLAHLVVVQTEEQVELCREKLGREPALIRNIAEPAEARQGGGDFFLWLGRVVWYKGPLAFVELAKALPEARFVAVAIPVADELELLAELESAAAEQQNLEILSPRPRRELAGLYGSAVAVVNTSRFEGMPNTTLEGWAHGVPALTLEHDPDRLIARNRLGVFADGDWARFVAGARSLWESRDDAEELSSRCREFISERHGVGGLTDPWLEALGLTDHIGKSGSALGGS